MATPKQLEQRRLRVALGTCKGFHGYLHNLRYVVTNCIPKQELLLTSYWLNGDIDKLHHQLRVTEDQIKRQLKNLDKLFPVMEKNQ